MQLVLNTIYFLDRPIENVAYLDYMKVKKLGWVEHAIPFALGDTTDDGRYRIVGTFPEYFDVEYVPGRNFVLQEGSFLKTKRDAVIGARVARAYRWKVGKKFPIAHRGNTSDIHDEKFTVAGVLAPTGLPLDRAVFIHYDGFYDIRGHGMTKKEAEAEAAARRREDGEIMVRNVGPEAGDGGAEPPPK